MARILPCLVLLLAGLFTQRVFAQQQNTANPQSKVGGIDEVNQLFAGEDIGNEPIQPQNNNKTTYIIALATVLTGVIIALIVLWKKSKKSYITEVEGS